MKRILIPAILILLGGSVTAQHITLSGRIADKLSAEPLPFANVTLYTTTDTLFVNGSTTDLEGRFFIKAVEADTYLMRITMVGYQRLEQELSVVENTDLGTLKLDKGAMLSEVSISATRPVFTMDGEKNIYNTSDDPSIQSGSTLDALQNAPGIEVDAEGNIRLRGNQEVSIWINGRESRMNAEALKQYLRTSPAANLTRIEVITNPSARYGGARPVVNIVTKDKINENQLLSFGINSSSRPEVLPWISYIYNDEKWEADLYANLAYFHENLNQKGQETLLNSNGDTSRTDRYTRIREERSLNAMVSADLAYHPDSLISIYAWISVMPSWTGWESTTDMHRREYIYMPGDHSFEEQMRKDLRGRPSNGFLDGIWLERTFGMSTGHTLAGGYYGSLCKRDSLVEGVRNFSAYSPLQFRQKNEGKEWFHCMEVSYLKPFGKMDSLRGASAFELEAGGEASFTRSLSIVTTDTARSGDLSNCRWMSSSADARDISADFYVSMLRRWERFTLKGGLRCETQKGNILYPDDSSYNFSHQCTRIIPSIHLTYTTARQHTFALGYTYRTGAPNTGDFSSRKIYTLDGYVTGNPLLKNSSAHNLELKWDMYKDGLGSLGVNCYYSSRSNHQGTMTDVVMDDDIFHRIVTFGQPVNIGSSWKGGVDLHGVYRPNAFVNVRLTGNIYYDHIDLEYRNEHYRNGMLCYTLRLNTWVKLWEKIQLFGNAYYISPTQSLFSTTLSRKGINLGVNAELFDRRLSLNAGVNDIFDWNSWSNTSANPYLMSETDLKLTSRYVSFSATLRFGKVDLCGPDRRTAIQKR